MILPAAVYSETSHLQTIKLSNDIDAEIIVHPASGEHVILWISPGYGFRKSQHQLASILPKSGIEVWMADINDTLFLPKGTTAMRQLTGQYVAEIIEKIHQPSLRTMIRDRV